VTANGAGSEPVVNAPGHSEFRQLGTAALTMDLATFALGPGGDAQRDIFIENARRGMPAAFLRGHTVCDTTLSAMEVVVMILTKWSEDGQPHPEVSSLPLGLRDLVLSWVSYHCRYSGFVCMSFDRASLQFYIFLQFFTLGLLVAEQTNLYKAHPVLTTLKHS